MGFRGIFCHCFLPTDDCPLCGHQVKIAGRLKNPGLASRQSRTREKRHGASSRSPDHAKTARVPLSMSHIGIYVHDVPKMEDFYTRVLGFTVTDRGKVRGLDIVFTSWDAKDHHQVILVAGRPKDLAFNHINQMSFRVASVEDLQAVWRKREGRAGRHRHARHGPWQCMVALFPRSRRQPHRNFLRHAMVHRAAMP